MRFFSVSNWLKTPNDRDVIARWTVGGTNPAAAPPSYRLEFPVAEGESSDEPWEFLVVGDTGDADSAGPKDSPQDAVGREMARDASSPVGDGKGRLLVHTGDVIYMTGERRLYDRNFRRPYAPFLTTGSTVGNLTFRLPFLPVPGNHDYYDLGTWASWLARVPILRKGLRAITHELFAFGLPEGGSDMGRAYMEAFVDHEADTRTEPLPYISSEKTRLPNRYYQFSRGNVDFFALDSNTLEAPAPEETDLAQVRLDAKKRIATLETKAEELETLLRREQRIYEKQRVALYQQIGTDHALRTALAAQSETIAHNIDGLHGELMGAQSQTTTVPATAPLADAARLADRVQRIVRRWNEGATDLKQADSSDEVENILRQLDETSDDTCAALSALELVLTDLEKGDPLRNGLLTRRDALERSQTEWARATSPGSDTPARIHRLSEELLDVQRGLALARRRQQYRPEDYDRAQIEWLDAALMASVQERPNAWRIVYLHHPLYTTISNHCERDDVKGIRNNLQALFQRYNVHVIFTGHSHAFEWIRSSAMPNVGFFVSGGGGQISLRPSLLEPRRLPKLRGYYDALRQAGAEECVMSGYGPTAADGESGLIYHYLRVAVTPDAITVYPVGVRRLSDRTYRREEPMPVFHAPYLPETRPSWSATKLAAVVIRRDTPPRAQWR